MQNVEDFCFVPFLIIKYQCIVKLEFHHPQAAQFYLGIGFYAKSIKSNHG
jgi:hypothetical protein